MRFKTFGKETEKGRTIRTFCFCNFRCEANSDSAFQKDVELVRKKLLFWSGTGTPYFCAG